MSIQLERHYGSIYLKKFGSSLGNFILNTFMHNLNNCFSL